MGQDALSILVFAFNTQPQYGQVLLVWHESMHTAKRFLLKA